MNYPELEIQKHRYAVCSFIPPMIPKKIIEEGSPYQRAKALRDLEVSIALRKERHIRSSMHGMLVSAGERKHRMLYDMANNWSYSTLPGNLIRSEGEPDIRDEDADKAYYNSGHLFDFYKDVFGRTSIDGKGMLLLSCVHFGQDWNNAHWTGQYMIYGDGNGLFKEGNNHLTDLIVCAHELTHGVTEIETGLGYEGESGGLNEAMSDIFGIMCVQWVNKQRVDDSRWLIGEGAVESGDALRSMKEPGTAFSGDPQISNYMDFDPSMDPHVSSGIINKAFYLTCMEIGGYSWEKAGKIWYIALKSDLKEDSTFQDAANITYTLASQLFGTDIQKAVRKGWEGVGLKPESISVKNFIKLRSSLNV